MERPIIFSAPMVRALLDGRKRQTRRILKPSNAEFGSAPREYWEHGDFSRAYVDGAPQSGQYLHVPAHDPDCDRCIHMGWDDTVHRLWPRYEGGSRLWVREDWKPVHSGDRGQGARYRADAGFDQTVWKVARYMPRWASRLTLTVSLVRVQRLHDISEEDAIAEGIVDASAGGVRRFLVPGVEHPNRDFPELSRSSAREMFAALWDTIHGPGKWLENPWVIATSFRPEKRNIDAPTPSSN